MFFCENSALQLFSVLLSILPDFYEHNSYLLRKILWVTLWETKILILVHIGPPRSSLYWRPFFPPCFKLRKTDAFPEHSGIPEVVIRIFSVRCEILATVHSSWRGSCNISKCVCLLGIKPLIFKLECICFFSQATRFGSQASQKVIIDLVLSYWL